MPPKSKLWMRQSPPTSALAPPHPFLMKVYFVQCSLPVSIPTPITTFLIFSRQLWQLCWRPNAFSLSAVKAEAAFLGCDTWNAMAPLLTKDPIRSTFPWSCGWPARLKVYKDAKQPEELGFMFPFSLSQTLY